MSGVEHSAESRFFNGTPCGRCGSVLRYASSRACVSCAKEKARVQHAKRQEAKAEAGRVALKRLGLR